MVVNRAFDVIYCSDSALGDTSCGYLEMKVYEKMLELDLTTENKLSVEHACLHFGPVMHDNSKSYSEE